MRFIVVFLIANTAWSETSKVLDFSIIENHLSLDRVLVSKNRQDYAVRFNFDQHTVKIGLDLNKTPIRQSSLYSLNYFYDWRLAGFLSNESGLGLGYLETGYSLGNGQKSFPFNETALGAADYLRLKFGEKSYVRFGGSALRDLLDEENSWDSFKLEINGRIALDLPVIQNWLADFSASAQTYNPKRYWFADKRNVLNLRMGPDFSGNGWHSQIFGGVLMDRLNTEPERKILSGGLIFALETARNRELELKLIASNENSNRADSVVLSLAYNRPDQSYEIYGLVRNGPVWQKEQSVGFKIQLIAIGGQKSDKRNMPIPEEYREPSQRSRFYSNYGFTDDSNLNLQEQTVRLNSLRLRNEWSGKNLRYRWDTVNYYQKPSEIYKFRSGNCYYQSNLTSWIDQSNGYSSYVVGYYPAVSPQGHQVEIVQDPRTGRWFVDEYGILQELKVSPGAPLETVAWEALKQGAAFTALPIGSSQVNYNLGKLAEDGNGFDADFSHSGNRYWERNDFQSTAGSQPRLEKGFELFFGPDALWR